MEFHVFTPLAENRRFLAVNMGKIKKFQWFINTYQTYPKCSPRKQLIKIVQLITTVQLKHAKGLENYIVEDFEISRMHRTSDSKW